MSLTPIAIRAEDPIGTISPRLYGHFAEHLGRSCYDGLWVGDRTDVPHSAGFRQDVVEALRELPVPFLRWPGGFMWRTPTYHALRLHAPHIGATALPVEVSAGTSLPDASAAISGTASRSETGMAVALINRHRHAEAEVCIEETHGFASARGQLLHAAAPNAANSADEPDHVVPTSIAVAADGRCWRLELPPHSLATIQLG
jgi:alpha-L-arabinofuranosidase